MAGGAGRGDTVSEMEISRDPVAATIRLDGEVVVSETTWTRLGADTVVVATAIPVRGLGLSFTSTYLGNPGTDTIGAHALARAGRSAESWSRRIAESELPAAAVFEVSLLDHLGQLQDVLVHGGHRVQIALPEDDLAEVVPHPEH